MGDSQRGLGDSQRGKFTRSGLSATYLPGDARPLFLWLPDGWAANTQLNQIREWTPMTQYVDALVSVAVIHLTATAIPGPNVLLVMRTAMTRSRRDGLAITMGIALSDLGWALAAIVGLNALLTHFAWLSTGVRILGGCYLVYLGMRTWQSGRTDAEVTPDGRRGTWGSLSTGLLTNLANPKSAIFFGSVFATSLPTGAPPWVWVSVLGIIGANAIWWHCALTMMFTLEPAQRAYRRIKIWGDRVLGGLLLSVGAYFVATAHK